MLLHRVILSFCAAGWLFFACETAAAADLLKPTADAPQYQLSNLRIERDRFGRSGIAMDFRRVRPGKGSVSVSGKSGKGPLSITALIPSSEESGTIRLESLFGGDVTTDIELYLAQKHRLTASQTMFSMVSNAVRLGNPGEVSTTRAWTAEEQAMHKEFVRIMNDDAAHKPPGTYPVGVQVPDGSEFVPNTAKLTKGIRLHACYQNKWYPLTTISENDDGSVNIRWDDYGADFDCSMSRGELIIATSLLGDLGKHPVTRFPATVPNWASESAKSTPPTPPTAKAPKPYPVSIAVPQDSELVPQDLKLKPGVPLQACYAGKWNPITTLGENSDGTLQVRWDDYGAAFDCSMVRNELIIKKELAQRLRANGASVTVAAPSISAKPHKKYPLTIAVPSNSVTVPTDAELKPGTQLQACYASKWNPITFLSANSDGTLNVRWDDYGPSFDCSMARNELIIKKEDLKASKASSPTMEMRTYTDATGKFKVKAKIIKQTETQVTLLTEAGKEVTLQLSKLSQADQDFLRSNSKSENPFE